MAEGRADGGGATERPSRARDPPATAKPLSKPAPPAEGGLPPTQPPPAEEGAACTDGAEARPGGTATLALLPSRRGGESLRARTLTALERAEWPAFPPLLAEKGEAAFECPPGMVDQEAPLSARKWSLALSLAERQAHVLAKRRRDTAAAAAAASAASEEAKRTRRPTAIMRQNVEVARMMGVPGSKQKHVSHEEMHAGRPKGAASPAGRPSNGRAPPPPPRRQEEAAGSRPLPVVASMPSEPARALAPCLVRRVVSGAATARRVTGVMLREPNAKRRRRPPGWLLEHEQGEDEWTDDASPTLDASRRKRRPLPPPVVGAALVDARADDGGGEPCVLTVFGVLPSAPLRTRPQMPPPTPCVPERSPRRLGGATPKRHGAEDAFQVYVGDLPSPRMIEVVRPKELQVPQWRVVCAPEAEANGEAGCGAGGGGGGEESEAEDTSDAAYEARHTRTLEQAITAARAVARSLAAKERQKQQQQGGGGGGGGGGGAEDEAVGRSDEAEWRFRPSELAALCAAQRMQLDGSGGGVANGGGSTVGFFGRGGGNRGRPRDGEDAAADEGAREGEDACAHESEDGRNGGEEEGEDASDDAALQSPVSNPPEAHVIAPLTASLTTTPDGAPHVNGGVRPMTA